MNQISKGVGNCPWVCWFGSILKTPLTENHFKKLRQFGRQQRVIDRTFQILKAFIFTIGLTFLQAKSMSNKFAITLQDQFCSYSTFLILATAMSTKLQGIKTPMHFHTETYMVGFPGEPFT